MYDLSKFTLSDMTKCGAELRKLGSARSTMEDVAGAAVRALFEQLRGPELGAPACALVRLFVTMPYSALEPAQQAFVRELVPDAPDRPSMKCLTLLATVGEDPAWNSRHSSAAHKALPLVSPESVSRSPMIAQLMRQLGVELTTLLDPAPGFVVDEHQHSFNVFHIPQALGSPYIPAQREFVQPHGVRSVLGFGGLLPPAELFAVILFSKVPIPRQVADLFKTLALNVRVALLPFAGGRVFS